MTKERAQQFREQWKLVHDVTTKEISRLTLSDRLRQLGGLYNFAQTIGWPSHQSSDESSKDCWRRLKERCNV